jgi:hypothetical protein
MPATYDQVDITPKQTIAETGVRAPSVGSHPVADELVDGDQALVLGRELAALHRVPKI